MTVARARCSPCRCCASQTILTDAVWATFFAANVRMAQDGTDYFAKGQPPSPLRHYWSLAVEEQFYLVWPLLLVALPGADPPPRSRSVLASAASPAC